MSAPTLTYDASQPLETRIENMRVPLPVPFDHTEFPYHRRSGKPSIHFQRSEIVASIVLKSGEDGLTHREITSAYERETRIPMERGYFNYMRKILSMTYNDGAERFVAWKIPGRQETRYLFTSDGDKMSGNLRIARKNLMSTLQSKQGAIAVLETSPDPAEVHVATSLRHALEWFQIST